MYTDKETRLIQLFLKRISNKRFRIAFEDERIRTISPYLVGTTDKTKPLKPLKGNEYLVHIVMLLPTSDLLLPSVRNITQLIVRQMGCAYGLDICCSIFTIDKWYPTSHIQDFHTKFNNIVVNENVEIDILY